MVRYTYNHCRKQGDDQRSKGQFFQQPLLRQIDLSPLVRVSLIRSIVVEVYLLLMRMIRCRWIVIIDVHMQWCTLDKNDGRSQIDYPENFRECRL